MPKMRVASYSLKRVMGVTEVTLLLGGGAPDTIWKEELQKVLRGQVPPGLQQASLADAGDGRLMIVLVYSGRPEDGTLRAGLDFAGQAIDAANGSNATVELLETADLEAVVADWIRHRGNNNGA